MACFDQESCMRNHSPHKHLTHRPHISGPTISFWRFPVVRNSTKFAIVLLNSKHMYVHFVHSIWELQMWWLYLPFTLFGIFFLTPCFHHASLLCFAVSTQAVIIRKKLMLYLLVCNNIVAHCDKTQKPMYFCCSCCVYVAMGGWEEVGGEIGSLNDSQLFSIVFPMRITLIWRRRKKNV